METEGELTHLIKAAFKRRLLASQTAGDQDEWPIFLLNSVKGLRSKTARHLILHNINGV